jgi:hypothetical protein
MSFKSVQKKIAGQGHSMESAGAILANASRRASPAAKRANPKLNRVKGKMHAGGVIQEDGKYEMQAGEKVIPAKADAKPNAAMRHEDGIMVRSSTEETRKPMLETVSSTPNHGCPREAQPVKDAGHDSGVGHWEGDGQDVHFVKA